MPNGEQVVVTVFEYIGNDNFRDVTEIVNVADGSVVRRLFEDEHNHSGNSVGPFLNDISPDGKWAVAVAQNVDKLMLIPTNGSGNVRFITPALSGQPFWPHSCNRGADICYVSPSAWNELRAVNMETGEDRVVDSIASGHVYETPRSHPLFPQN